MMTKQVQKAFWGRKMSMALLSALRMEGVTDIKFFVTKSMRAKIKIEQCLLCALFSVLVGLVFWFAIPEHPVGLLGAAVLALVSIFFFLKALSAHVDRKDMKLLVHQAVGTYVTPEEWLISRVDRLVCVLGRSVCELSIDELCRYAYRQVVFLATQVLESELAGKGTESDICRSRQRIFEILDAAKPFGLLRVYTPQYYFDEASREIAKDEKRNAGGPSELMHR